MRNVIAIHMEVIGSSRLEHIAELRWAPARKAGERSTSGWRAASRAEMYAFVRDNPNQAYAISRNDDTYAYLEHVDGHVQYVKTMPDSSKSDNLLSLPRY